LSASGIDPPVQWPDQNGMMQWLSYEDWLYMTLFPATIRAGSGLNTVTRAIDVALCMGFEKITVLGADCAMRTTGKMPDTIIPGTHQHTEWLKANTVLHADGGHALASNQTALTLGAEIDSRHAGRHGAPGHGKLVGEQDRPADLGALAARWRSTTRGA
jgi:hypothetical protein